MNRLLQLTVCLVVVTKGMNLNYPLNAQSPPHPNPQPARPVQSVSVQGTPRTQIHYVDPSRQTVVVPSIQAVQYQPMNQYGQTTQPPSRWQVVNSYLMSSVASMQRQRQATELAEDEESCSICLSKEYSTNEGDELCRYRTRCPTEGGHLFHAGCLARWFVRAHDCPNCRTDLSLSDVQFLARETHRIRHDTDNASLQTLEYDTDDELEEEAFRRAIGEDMNERLDARREQRRRQMEECGTVTCMCCFGCTECSTLLLTLAFFFFTYIQLADVSFTGCLTWMSTPIVTSTGGRAWAIIFMIASCICGCIKLFMKCTGSRTETGSVTGDVLCQNFF